MGGKKSLASRAHLPANRHAIPTNTLSRRIPHATLITIHLAPAHIVTIKCHPAPAYALLRVQLVNAMLSTRSPPHNNQLLRRTQRLVPHSRANPSGNAIEKPQRVPASKTKPIRLRVEHSSPQCLLKAHLALNECRIEELGQERQVARSASNRNLTSTTPVLNDSRTAQSLRQIGQANHVHGPHRPAPTLYPDVNDLHILPGRVHVGK